jgi:hypothetical protein
MPQASARRGRTVASKIRARGSVGVAVVASPLWCLGRCIASGSHFLLRRTIDNLILFTNPRPARLIHALSGQPGSGGPSLPPLPQGDASRRPRITRCVEDSCTVLRRHSTPKKVEGRAGTLAEQSPRSSAAAPVEKAPAVARPDLSNESPSCLVRNEEYLAEHASC